MKPLFLIAISLSLSLSSLAQAKVNWMSWEEAVEASKTEPRLVFVDMYTSWCGWCKTMDRNTFANPVIAEVMNDHYYAVKMNAEMKDAIDFNGYQFVNPRPKGKRSAHQLAASLLENKLSYPSFVFLNGKFERLQIVPGYKSPQQFEPIIRYFVEGAPQSVPYEKYMQTFETRLKKKPQQAKPTNN